MITRKPDTDEPIEFDDLDAEEELDFDPTRTDGYPDDWAASGSFDSDPMLEAALDDAFENEDTDPTYSTHVRPWRGSGGGESGGGPAPLFI